MAPGRSWRPRARVRPLHLISDAGEAPRSGVASTVLAQAQVVLPLAGLIDVDGERARLSKQLAEAGAGGGGGGGGAGRAGGGGGGRGGGGCPFRVHATG